MKNQQIYNTRPLTFFITQAASTSIVDYEKIENNLVVDFEKIENLRGAAETDIKMVARRL